MQNWGWVKKTGFWEKPVFLKYTKIFVCLLPYPLESYSIRN